MWYTEKSRRERALIIVVFAVIALLVGRLAWMQLLQGNQYKKIAEENRTRKFYQQAPRGTIYDRNGAVLVSNRPSFAVSIIPAEYASPETATPFLAALTGIPETDISAMLKQAEDFPYTPIKIKRDIDQSLIAKIEEQKDVLPGVIIEAVPIRHYVYGQLAAQVLGYIGRINEDEYATRKNAGYNPSDLIGKDGLERVWEEYLRGVDGGRQVEVNAQGEEVRVEGETTAIPGRGLVTTLDANLQKVAEDALDEYIAVSRNLGEPAKGGAVVVIDVKTGALRVLASKPAFDPNAFATGITSRDWDALLANPNNPLANRGIQSAFPPGSVFKIVTAAAALQMGLTTASEVFNDTGVYVLNGWSFYGWEPKGLGRLTISGALTMSSDPVFYELGRRVGVDNLASYALTFGFGNLTGIKLLGEEKGVVPTEEWKLATYGEPWYPGETIIAAIGQGYYLATPLQQALLLMAVANGGVVYRPMLVDRILNPDGTPQTTLTPEILRNIYLRPDIWQTIRQGLEGVPVSGTAASGFQGFPKPIAGKTGSAETGRGTVHSWFACYAPAANPEIAVAALVEEAGEGAVAAVPLVRKVLEAYFGLPDKPAPPAPPGTSD
jgi:penicillin-binding protein 2